MIRTLPVLGTPLAVTTYAELADYLCLLSSQAGPFCVDFSNTHIVTMRRHDPDFLALTNCMDLFVPDGMPLIWALNRQGAGLSDRVYGPTFLRECLRVSPPHIRHYFLGGSQECLDALLGKVSSLNPGLTVVGKRNGYFSKEQEADVLESIIATRPDFVWIGLGTPKQQEFINRWKPHFAKGILLAVGFAFDVNAGTKPDAPAWMQKRGLTWLYRLCSEPRRLLRRYAKWNSLFLWYKLKERMKYEV